MTGRWLVVAAIFAIATGCVPRIEKRVKGTGMLVGHWAVPDGYWDLKALSMERIHLPLINPQPVAYVGPGGHFAFSNLPPGKYRITEFTSRGLIHSLQRPLTMKEWATGDWRGSEDFDFEVKADAVTYAGSWAKTAEKTGFFGGVTGYDFEARKSPTRSEVLGALIPLAKNTGWEELMCEDLGPACTGLGPTITASLPDAEPSENLVE